jgi:hypothetical protein
MHAGFLWETKMKEDDLDVGGRIILKWILERYDGVVLSGFFCLGIGTSGELL